MGLQVKKLWLLWLPIFDIMNSLSRIVGANFTNLCWPGHNYVYFECYFIFSLHFIASYEQFAQVLLKSKKHAAAGQLKDIELPQATPTGKTSFSDLEVSYVKCIHSIFSNVHFRMVTCFFGKCPNCSKWILQS